MPSLALSSEQSPISRWLTIQRTSIYSGLSVSSLRRLVSSGRLRASRVNRRILIDIEDLDRLLEESK